VSFEKPFFSAIFQTHENQKSSRFRHFLTDKGPNIVNQYDFWAIIIFTSLGLALKMIIFGFFCPKFWDLVWPGFFSWTKHDRRINFRLF
jgi:hypothetical protein